MTAAYTIRNNNATQKHTESAQEFLSSITISQNTPTGTLFQFMLNPLDPLFRGTRLQNLAKSYGKFRFRKMKLTIASNFSTTVSGSLISGYMENPDQLLASGKNPDSLIRQVYATQGATSKSLWTPIDIVGRITDRNKWYNLDDTSNEVMQTTQGKFVIVVQSPVAITNTVSVPVMLDYTIEFTEPAIQNTGVEGLGTPFTYPTATFINRSSEEPGQYHLNTGGMTLPSGVVQYINGGLQLDTADGTEMASFMVYNNTAGKSTGFYATLESAIAASGGIVAAPLLGAKFTIPNITLQTVNF